jgi:acyl CoA:acetate/3-ketoacid CoA transferase alpha subunit
MYRSIVRYLSSSSKIVSTADEAVAGIKNGNFLLFGGFGLCGIPMNLIAAISRTNVKDLVIASNDGGAADIHGDHAWGL